MGGGAAVFGIDGGEFVVLALLALFLLGPERLPGLAKQAARALHDVRRWAQRTRDDIGRELGPEFENFDLADLNPRKFVQKHLLDPLEDDDEPIAARTYGSAALASRTGDALVTGDGSAADGSPDVVSLQKSPVDVHQPEHTVDLDGLRTPLESDAGVLELVGAPIGPMLTTDVFADHAFARTATAPRSSERAVPVVPSWGDTASAAAGSDLEAQLQPPIQPQVEPEISWGAQQLAGTPVDESSSWALSYYVAPPIDLDAT